MTDQTEVRKQVFNEIENRKSMGDKKYHSETSLQQFGDEEGSTEEIGNKDPGVCLFTFYLYIIINNIVVQYYFLTQFI